MATSEPGTTRERRFPFLSFFFGRRTEGGVFVHGDTTS